MKLVLKLPKDKPPFIGIQFPGEYIASKTNNDLVWLLEKEDCKLILEPYDKYYLNLRLVNTDKVVDRTYKQIEYNSEKLKNWLAQTQNQTKFNFAHLILDYDTHVVVKASTINKNFIIRLNEVKVITEI